MKKKQVLFIYSSKNLKGSNKVRFFYALKGRLKYPGILEKTNSKFVQRGVILSPFENFKQISEFLKLWNCKFAAFQVEKEMGIK